MNAAYLFIYRSYVAVKRSVLDRTLNRWPRAQRGLAAATEFVRRRVFPDREIWVRVQFGLAQDLWMNLRMPEEAGFWRGEHETGIQRQIAGIVRPGDVVYDVGAHLGSLALGAARIVGSAAGGHVVAFEADPSTVERLLQNAVRNGLQQSLHAVHAALWSRAEAREITFRRGKDNLSQGGVEADGHRPVLAGLELIRVPVTTLDQFIAAGNAAPTLIKVDVEGGEYEVLRGGCQLFAAHRPLLIVEVHHQSACDSLTEWLTEFRYACEWKTPPENFPRYLLAWPAERPKPFLD